MNKNTLINIIGIFFLILGLASISRIFFVNAVWQNVFWWCDHTALIIGIAILTRSKFWLTAELNIALIPQFLWSIDFLGKVFFNKFIFGFTAYMFEGHWAFKIISYQHLFVFILALIALFLLGSADKHAWIGSIIHGCFLFLAGLLISANYNINCVHKNCLNFNVPYYSFFWIISFLIMIFLTNFILTKIFSKQKK